MCCLQASDGKMTIVSGQQAFLTLQGASLPSLSSERTGDYGLYGRGATLGVVPSTQAGLPCDVMVTLELVKPEAVASMTVVPA